MIRTIRMLVGWVCLPLVLVTGCSANGSETAVVATAAIAESSQPVTAQADLQDAYPFAGADPASVPASPSYPGPAQMVTPYAIGELPEPVLKAGQPAEGLASLSGLLFAYPGRIKLADTVFYLTPAMGDNNDVPVVFTGPDPEVGDITGRTDENGEFVLNDIPPGNFYLVVWSPQNWSLAVTSTDPSTIPLLISLTPSQSLDLGVIQTEWP
jgi:hypothetical protein